MSWEVLIQGQLYKQTFTAQGEGQVNLQEEISQYLVTIPPLPGRGYSNFTCTGSFLALIDASTGWYDEANLCVNEVYGYTEIRYGSYMMWFSPINRKRLGLPKFTGATDYFASPVPGNVTVVGNGATLVAVNVGSDRPYRGDTIYYNLIPGVTFNLTVALSVQSVINTSNTNKYWLNW